MTTPAVNINSILRIDGRRYAYSPSLGRAIPGTESVSVKGTFAQVKTETRPASTNHPKVNGWRQPGPWSHSGTFRAFVAPNYRGTLLGSAFDPVTGKNTQVYLVYEDGGLQLDSSSYGLPAFPTKLEDTAINRALLKLKQQNVNLGQAFAERRETARLLEDVCGKIAGSVKRFRSSSPKDWARVLRSSANRGQGYDVPGGWLEVQYGWNPLMQDVQGACKALDSSVEKRPPTVKCVARASDPIRGIYRRSTNLNANFGWYCDVKGKHESRVRLDYTLNNALLATFSSLGLTNPAVIVWERIPYSFVVDWFLPVGNYLSAWDADFGWSFKAGSIVRDSKVAVLSQGGPRDNLLGTGPLANLVSLDGQPWSENNFRYSRTILASSPTPRVPSFKDPFTAGHIANAMSLLVNCFR
ncbi:TPA_asm: maturation protein [ssRNA phage Gerhypos.1_20]|uniref:Maturation protein n=2 Tax=Fiersviridae TaxID=2842319 RepID=A0A8S5KXT9_9VIRU|nr:maturation protein [ssRNA phage Gerhypos.1_20]QDH86752.1 MAG: hypothetical protein H1Bulk29353_000001 [Leviviridae sp.]DAD49972.1 TPA_asm: maturation protein [ssRNA phage Gerhypos.1_20]